MENDLHKRVLQAIHRHGMFRPGDRVGVAVSGGADSVALLRLLDDLRAELGIRLTTLHFNHQLRGVDSDADEEFVASLAVERGIEFLAGREDVAAAAREHKWNLEDAARRLRYGFFRATLKRANLASVAVAHSADDQAETVLARLARGTGPAGLAAIYPVKGNVVRPLLEIRRNELRVYLEGIGQAWREDLSNHDVQRLRARLRHQILPVLERGVQPALVQHLCRLAELSREDEAFWKALVLERLAALVQREGGRMGIRCADLLAPLPWATEASEAQAALRGRLVRGIIEELRKEELKSEELRGEEPREEEARSDWHMLTAQHVKQVLRLATSSSSGHHTELPGAVAERTFDWIWFAQTGKGGTQAEGHPSNGLGGGNAAFSHTVNLDPAAQETVVAVPEICRRFSLKVIDWNSLQRETRLLDVLDGDLLRSPLVLRNWQPGDSFQPQGRRHIHKLKQLLRERRVAIRERSGWPVLTSAGLVAWARGCPVAARFAAGKDTRNGVVITEEKI